MHSKVLLLWIFGVLLVPLPSSAAFASREEEKIENSLIAVPKTPNNHNPSSNYPDQRNLKVALKPNPTGELFKLSSVADTNNLSTNDISPTTVNEIELIAPESSDANDTDICNPKCVKGRCVENKCECSFSYTGDDCSINYR